MITKDRFWEEHKTAIIVVAALLFLGIGIIVYANSTGLVECGSPPTGMNCLTITSGNNNTCVDTGGNNALDSTDHCHNQADCSGHIGASCDVSPGGNGICARGSPVTCSNTVISSGEFGTAISGGTAVNFHSGNENNSCDATTEMMVCVSTGGLDPSPSTSRICENNGCQMATTETALKCADRTCETNDVSSANVVSPCGATTEGWACDSDTLGGFNQTGQCALQAAAWGCRATPTVSHICNSSTPGNSLIADGCNADPSGCGEEAPCDVSLTDGDFDNSWGQCVGTTCISNRVLNSPYNITFSNASKINTSISTMNVVHGGFLTLDNTWLAYDDFETNNFKTMTYYFSNHTGRGSGTTQFGIIDGYFTQNSSTVDGHEAMMQIPYNYSNNNDDGVSFEIYQKIPPDFAGGHARSEVMWRQEKINYNTATAPDNTGTFVSFFTFYSGGTASTRFQYHYYDNGTQTGVVNSGAVVEDGSHEQIKLWMSNDSARGYSTVGGYDTGTQSYTIGAAMSGAFPTLLCYSGATFGCNHTIDRIIVYNTTFYNSSNSSMRTIPLNTTVSVGKVNLTVQFSNGGNHTSNSWQFYACDINNANCQTISPGVNDITDFTGLIINITGTTGSTNETNILDWFSVAIEESAANTAPTINQVIINTTTLSGGNRTNESLTAWVNATDVDVDSMKAHVRWFNQSVEKTQFQNTTSITDSIFSLVGGDINNQFTHKNENWTAMVIVDDGTANATAWVNASIFINNTAPVINNLFLNSSPSLNKNLTSDTLFVWLNPSDIDNETTFSAFTRWFNDTTEVASLASSRNISLGTLDNVSFSKVLHGGENWTAMVRIYDGDVNTSFVNTSSVIINTLPVINQVILNSTVVLGRNNTNESLEVWLNASDANSQAMQGHVRWFNQSIEIPELTKTFTTTQNQFTSLGTIAHQNTTKNHVWTAMVIVSDGLENATSFVNATITIVNFPSIIHNLRLNSSPSLNLNLSKDNLSLWASVADLDNETTFTSFFRWFNGTTEAASLASQKNISLNTQTNLSFVNNDTFHRGENWTAMVRIYDGNDNTSFFNTTSLIINTPPNASIVNWTPSTIINGSFLNRSISFNISATDVNGDSMRYWVYQSLNPTLSDVDLFINHSTISAVATLNFTRDAELWYQVNVDDGKENTTTTRYVWRFDNTTPNIYIITPLNGTNSTNTTWNVTFYYNDTISTTANCTFTLDSNASTSFVSVPNQTEQSTTFTAVAGFRAANVTCTDLAFNVKISNTTEFYVDPNITASASGSPQTQNLQAIQQFGGGSAGFGTPTTSPSPPLPTTEAATPPPDSIVSAAQKSVKELFDASTDTVARIADIENRELAQTIVLLTTVVVAYFIGLDIYKYYNLKKVVQL